MPKYERLCNFLYVAVGGSACSQDEAQGVYITPGAVSGP